MGGDVVGHVVLLHGLVQIKMHSFLALDFYSPASALAGSLACLLLGCLLFCCWPSVVFEKDSPAF